MGQADTPQKADLPQKADPLSEDRHPPPPPEIQSTGGVTHPTGMHTFESCISFWVWMLTFNVHDLETLLSPKNFIYSRINFKLKCLILSYAS